MTGLQNSLEFLQTNMMRNEIKYFKKILYDFYIMGSKPNKYFSFQYPLV